jgi:hypothetical protein
MNSDSNLITITDCEKYCHCIEEAIGTGGGKYCSFRGIWPNGRFHCYYFDEEIKPGIKKRGNLSRIFAEINKERERQNEKWGEQNHLMLNVPFTTAGMRQQEKIYKQLNNSARDVSWFGILMEEVYESFAETDPARQREEMIQVAAVAVQIIECLDRHMEEGK